MFRVQPNLPVDAYKTYSVSQPIQTHTRPATCAEVECMASALGWSTKVDVSTDLGSRQANYIRLQSGRRFTAVEVGTLVTFQFPPGQTCFAGHRRSLERDQIFRVRDGDWRGNPLGTPTITRNSVDWVDDFANNQDRLKTVLERG